MTASSPQRDTMEEKLAQHYYEKLSKEPNPSVVLTQMYCSYYSIPFSQALIKTFARLIKIYGRDIAFSSVLEVFGWLEENIKNPTGALFHVAKSLFEAQQSKNTSQDLSKSLHSNLEKVNRARKPNVSNIKDPFDE